MIAINKKVKGDFLFLRPVSYFDSHGDQHITQCLALYSGHWNIPKRALVILEELQRSAGIFLFLLLKESSKISQGERSQQSFH